MTDVDELAQTLLMEGYALYPYTPGASKNSTPTPFGIVYPPVYAVQSPTTHDHLRLQVIAEVDDPQTATLAIQVLFLEPSGPRHEAARRSIQLPATTLAQLEAEPVTVPFAFEHVQGRVRMTAQAFPDGLVRVTSCVHNTTEVPEGLDRPGALRSSLLSAHVIARIAGPGPARLLSPTAPPAHAVTATMTCASVNTFPVLASPDDDVVLGAAIVLPDHPQLAPESRGDLFDGTEIEEALLLHVLALSDGEVDEIAKQDPAIREMVRRAAATTPEQFAKLRGRITIKDVVPDAPPRETLIGLPTFGEELRGEQQVHVSGVTYRLGDRVRLKPEIGRNAQDHLLDGRPATIERIYIDYSDIVHLCVTVDDDPGQLLMRDIGRYLYFKPDEVEMMEQSPV